MKNYGPMLYAYPDSMGNHLSGTVEILNMQEFKGIFNPSIFFRVCIRTIWIGDFVLSGMIWMNE